MMRVYFVRLWSSLGRNKVLSACLCIYVWQHYWWLPSCWTDFCETCM